MSKLYLHHVLIAVDDLERARVLHESPGNAGNRPPLHYPGIWYKIGDGEQQLHILVRSEAMLRRDKWID